MNEELKKIVSVAIATGAIVSSAVYGVAKPGCDFILTNSQQEEICISREIKEAVESGLKPNKGFGGVQFGDK